MLFSLAFGTLPFLGWGHRVGEERNAEKKIIGALGANLLLALGGERSAWFLPGPACSGVHCTALVVLLFSYQEGSAWSLCFPLLSPSFQSCIREGALSLNLTEIGLDCPQGQQTLRLLSRAPQWLMSWAMMMIPVFCGEGWVSFLFGPELLVIMLGSFTLRTSESSLLLGFKLQSLLSADISFCLLPIQANLVEWTWDSLLRKFFQDHHYLWRWFNLQETHSASCSVCVKKIWVDN